LRPKGRAHRKSRDVCAARREETMKTRWFVAMMTAALVPAAGAAARASQSKPGKDSMPPPVQAPARIIASRTFMAPKLIHRVQPEYPSEAKKKGISGTVRLHAIVAKDGKLKGLKLISGDPILAKAAMKAVKRWRYKPTLLNGQPVEMITEVDVNFPPAGKP
jgi:TonB family protein